MPIPISHLFLSDDSQIHGHPRQKDIIDMSKDWPSIDIKIPEIPHIDYPSDQSKDVKNDLELIKSCYFNPMCDNRFLDISDNKPFKLFKPSRLFKPFKLLQLFQNSKRFKSLR